MLHDFIGSNRESIILRAKTNVTARMAPIVSEEEPTNAVPCFCDQLIETLRSPSTSNTDVDADAVKHWREMLGRGFTVAQVIHDYGKVCQAMAELALESNAAITLDEFHRLTRCLDDAIAEAVAEYVRQREQSISSRESERLGSLAHELRNKLTTAIFSFDALREGAVAAGGSTSALLGQSLVALRSLIDRSLAEVRIQSTVVKFERVEMVEFIEEARVAAAFEARVHGIRLIIAPVPLGIAVEMDRPLLASAVANLLQNACKFTHGPGTVTLRTQTIDNRLLIEIEDECGGLPPGRVDDLFRPFEQRSANRTGLGLGLSISLKAVRANKGDLWAHTLPGKGCVFTIDLPRLPLSRELFSPSILPSCAHFG